MHAVVAFDKGVAQVVDAEAGEALEGLVRVEVEVVRIAFDVFFFFFFSSASSRSGFEGEKKRALFRLLSLLCLFYLLLPAFSSYPMWCSVLSVSCAV